MDRTLLIGWSETDITPVTDKKIELYGQYYARIATGIHSRLKCVAAAFSDGKEQFLTASLDLVNFQEDFHKRVRAEVAKREPEIQPDKIFLNAIHTHNGPSTATVGLSNSWRKAASGALTADEYVEFVLPLIADNIVNAWRSRKPGGILRGFGNARVGHCRRAVYSNGKAEMYGDTTRRDFIGMEAGEDSGVDMLFTVDKSGKPTGMFLNTACPSQIMESTYKISSDFAGAARELLKKEFGKNFHMIYQISPAGCQSPRDLVRHYATEPDFWHEDGVAVMAERLLTAVRSAVLEKPDFSPVFKHTVKRVVLPRRRASYPEYVAAKAELERLVAIQPEKEAFADFCAETHANEKLDGHGPYDSKLHHFVLIKNAQAVIKRYEDQGKHPELSFDMNVVRLGDVAIANNPFELYLSYGQIIKARSKAAQTFLVQLSAGADRPAGYLPSPDAEKLGGYGGLIINGQVGSDGGYRLADITVDTINALF
ncbi:MAG: Neutral/alkaline non-lysosomal ceramidase [Lentisphaerae bacterium ADurb.Bin242]|nr:MAG: Neutral/alkaline non-lysosomal ceramidase [Lentisphaerae bacterium ADurb.Bin242]